VELCTIHFQKNYSDDYILSTSLFGDGCAVVLVESDDSAMNIYKGLKIKEFNSLIIHKGRNEMAWQITEKGFIMNLTSYVSELINGSLEEFLTNISLNKKDVNYWAIHPGGKKILDKIKTELDLDDIQLQASYQTLSDFGNMSSATIFFVLKHVLESENYQDNQIGFAAGFGPGLTVETLIFNN
jgi:predicted naringenin-chalcone synthase